MAMQDMSITTCNSEPGDPYFVAEEDYMKKCTEAQICDDEEDDGAEKEAYKHGKPKIQVVRKFQDWCVIQLSRGTGPRRLIKWILDNVNKCFDIPDLAYSSGSEVDGEDVPVKQTRDVHPVLINPHNSCYSQSLVLVARQPYFLKFLVDLRVTVHALVKARIKPGNELEMSSIIEGKEYATRATCLEVVPSNTAGWISLVVAQNDPKTGSCIAPRQFRRHLKDAGWSVLGAAKDAYSFRGESLCLSTVRLEFLVLGIETKQCICIPPAPQLRKLIGREERFWRQRRGQEELRVELFCDDIPKPREYIKEKATFDGLEFRVTPAVMIPRKGSVALVERCVDFYDKKMMSAPRPAVLDLGTGCGSLLLSLLNRLRHRNAVGLGIDMSREALELADYNIAALGMDQFAKTLQGRFAHIHLLKHEPFNLVLCNPPYHTRGGRKLLDAATVTHEPDRALFVEQDDALVHYRDVLAGLIRGKLVDDGALIVFEVFRDNVDAVATLMAKVDLENILVGTDSRDCIRTIEGTFTGMGQRHG